MCICDASALLFSCPKFIKFFLYTDSPLRLLSLSLGRAVHTFAWSYAGTRGSNPRDAQPRPSQRPRRC
jgi:hypothetical protein